MDTKQSAKSSSTYLILTVGTGTPSSDRSDLASGLQSTLEMLSPDGYWLIPSTDPVSIGIADLLAEENTGSFRAWDEGNRFLQITDVDDIFTCRDTIAQVIRWARRGMEPGDRLIVNPTSGTKQMSTGAVLAALQEEVGELQFTVGDRREGVVQCGTEKLAAFSTELFFAERALRQARELTKGGAYWAGAELLAPYAAVSKACENARLACLALHSWHRQCYIEGRDSARLCGLQGLEPARKALEGLAVTGELNQLVVADLLASADWSLSCGRPEDALLRLYRATELAAKLRLADEHDLEPPYRYEDLQRLSPTVIQDAAVRNRQDVTLGLAVTMQYLKDAGDPLASDYWEYHDRLQKRNQTFGGHGIESVDSTEISGLRDDIVSSFSQHFEDFDRTMRRVARPEDPLG